MIVVTFTCDECQEVQELHVLSPSSAEDIFRRHFAHPVPGLSGRYVYSDLCAACMDLAIQGGYEALAHRKQPVA